MLYNFENFIKNLFCFDCFDDGADRRRNNNSSAQRQKQKSKLKLEYLFSASFLRKMVKIRCDRHKATNRFDFIHLFSNENPSYPTHTVSEVPTRLDLVVGT